MRADAARLRRVDHGLGIVGEHRGAAAVVIPSKTLRPSSSSFDGRSQLRNSTSDGSSSQLLVRHAWKHDGAPFFPWALPGSRPRSLAGLGLGAYDEVKLACVIRGRREQYEGARRPRRKRRRTRSRAALHVQRRRLRARIKNEADGDLHDRGYGQGGAAPNGLELHPVLSVELGVAKH